MGPVLHELVVENYAVVERIRVRFHAGFNLLTGETGSGKEVLAGSVGRSQWPGARSQIWIGWLLASGSWSLIPY